MSKSGKIVWPLSVRFIHWTTAVIVLLNVFILEEGDPPHRYLGYVVFVAVLIRLVLGITGKDHVLLSSFPLSLHHLKSFLKKHFRKEAHYEGHNPFASVVYILIWVSIIGLTITGWMMGLDAFWGDEDLEIIHSKMSDFLMAMVIIHLFGILIDSFIYKRKTWMWMITGSKD